MLCIRFLRNISALALSEVQTPRGQRQTGCFSDQVGDVIRGQVKYSALEVSRRRVRIPHPHPHSLFRNVSLPRCAAPFIFPPPSGVARYVVLGGVAAAVSAVGAKVVACHQGQYIVSRETRARRDSRGTRHSGFREGGTKSNFVFANFPGS